MLENFTIGITAGLVVTIFALVFRGFWNAVIVPWFEERVYKDAKIEGKWFGLYPNQPGPKQDVIVLKRRGHEISGKMICTKGPDEGEEYTLCGSFRNMILPLTYESSDTSKTDRGSLTLMCIRNGERLSGKLASYNTYDDSIETVSILWFRSKDDMENIIKQIERRKEKLKALESERKEIERQEKDIQDAEIIEDEEQDTETDAEEKEANKSLLSHK